MSLKFNCTTCGQRLKAGTAFAGTRVECPRCRQHFIIPAESESPEPEQNLPESDGKPKPYFEPRKVYEDLSLASVLCEKGILSGKDGDANTEQAPSEAKYEVEEILDEGGMGAVYRVYDRNIRRRVAMKVALPPEHGSEIYTKRLIDEAQITGQLQHPGIMPVHDLNIDAYGSVYYTMKDLHGQTLEDILAKIRDSDEATLKRYPLSRLLNIFLKVCDAVGYAHSRGVIHRDLKPAHIMVGDYGEVVVMDWGISKVLSPPDSQSEQEQNRSQQLPKSPDKASRKKVQTLRDTEGDAGFTVEGEVVGTPMFMAPEQSIAKPELLSPRTDIYALGAILYNILTLRPPIEGKDPDKVLERVTRGDIIPPTQCSPPDSPASGPHHPPLDESIPSKNKSAAPGAGFNHCPGGRIPPSLSAVTMKALSRNPRDRYTRTRELQHDLEAWQAGYATSAEHAGPRKQFILFVRRNRTISAAAAAIVTLIFVGAVISTHYWMTAEKAHQRAIAQKNRAQTALNDLKSSAPAIARNAEHALRKGNDEQALKDISLATRLVPSNVSYLIFKAHLLQARLAWEKAAKAYQKVLEKSPKNDTARKNLILSQNMIQLRNAHDGVKAEDLTGFFEALREQERYQHAMIALNQAPRVEGKIPASFWKSFLRQHSIPYNSFRIDSEGIIRKIDLSNSDIRDLKPLRGIPLKSLNLNRTNVRELSPIKNMPLKYLHLRKTQVSLLAPLKGMELVFLDLSFTNIRNLDALKEMPLKHINLYNTQKVRDLRPISQIYTLEKLCIPPNATNPDALRALPNLRVLAMDLQNFREEQPPPQFWNKFAQKTDK